jgi:hypothetical protein
MHVVKIFGGEKLIRFIKIQNYGFLQADKYMQALTNLFFCDKAEQALENRSLSKKSCPVSAGQLCEVIVSIELRLMEICFVL